LTFLPCLSYIFLSFLSFYSFLSYWLCLPFVLFLSILLSFALFFLSFFPICLSCCVVLFVSIFLSVLLVFLALSVLLVLFILFVLYVLLSSFPSLPFYAYFSHQSLMSPDFFILLVLYVLPFAAQIPEAVVSEDHVPISENVFQKLKIFKYTAYSLCSITYKKSYVCCFNTGEHGDSLQSC
jgi:ABC-type transport system involved in multi-copper enzyme maturation permease subunit